MESPQTDPHIYGRLIFDKGAKAIQWRKDSPFDKWFYNKWISIYKKKGDLWSILCNILLTNINSKWTTDLNIKPKTVKSSGGKEEKNIGKNVFEHVTIMQNFPKAGFIKEQTDKLGFIKI